MGGMLLGLLLACACAPGAGARVAGARGLIVSVDPGRSLAVHGRPFGRILERLGARTEFGSRSTFGVVRIRDGRWLGVTVAGLGDRRLGWIDLHRGGFRLARTRLEIDIELSTRRLVVRKGSRILRSMLVGVGRPGSPTPTGRFSITDKLAGRFRPAISATQCLPGASTRATRISAT